MFPDALVKHLAERAVTFVFFVPSVLVAASRFDALSEVDLPSLRIVAFAGEVMPTKHLSYWQRHLPERLFVNLYGPTEITVDCTYHVVDRMYGPEERLPIGIPRSNMDVLVLDDRDQAVASGEVGELCVRGTSLALGYWNDPTLTATKFVQNPVAPQYGDVIYRTGDLVRWNASGQLDFIGRRDSQIKHRGYRIELEDIASAAESLDAIDRACALYEVNAQEIVLYYEARESLSRAVLPKMLGAVLPPYMIPRRFVFRENLPITANGKVDRKALRES